MTIFAVGLHWGYVWDNRGALLHGLLRALEVGALSTVASVVIGLCVGAARMSATPLRWLAAAYTNVFRAIPVVVSLLWVYFALAQQFGVDLSAFVAGVVALSLLYSAILSEIFRSALEAVPRAQREAGLALGMTKPRIFVSVTLPQATKIAVPSIGSMGIAMIKDTSLLFTIGFNDLIAVVQNLGAVSYQYFTLYTAAALIYVAVAFTVDFVFRTLEKTFTTPPRGRLALLATSRRRHRIEAIAARARV